MIFKGESKYKDKKLTEHFKVGEITCKDGSPSYVINSAVLEGLEKLRNIINKPIYITSGYRSETYNKKVGGAKDSQHVKGNAIDFSIKGMSSLEIYNILRQNNLLGPVFKGIGLYDTFVHVDVRPNPHKRGYSFWNSIKEQHK